MRVTATTMGLLGQVGRAIHHSGIETLIQDSPERGAIERWGEPALPMSAIGA
jgi:hypothetical protein